MELVIPKDVLYDAYLTLKELREEYTVLNEAFIGDYLRKSLQKAQLDIVKKYLEYLEKSKAKIKQLTGIDVNSRIKNVQNVATSNSSKPFTKEAAQKIAMEIAELLKDTKLYKQYKDKGFFSPIIKAIILFLVVLNINTYLCALVGNDLFIGAVIIAPIVEEWAKQFAAKYKFGKKYIHIFSWLEFLSYTAILTKYNYTFPAILAVRIPAVVMHYITARMYMSTEVLKQKLKEKGLDPKIVDEASKEELIKMFKELDKKALSRGRTVHALFNAGLGTFFVFILLFVVKLLGIPITA